MIEEARRSPRETEISYEELGSGLSFTDEEKRVARATADRWLGEDVVADATARKESVERDGARLRRGTERT